MISILKNSSFRQFLRVALLIIILFFIVFKIMSSLNLFTEELTCNAEEVVMNANKEYLLAKNFGIVNESGRTNEMAYEGKYSVKLSPDNQFGMSFTLDVPKAQEEYEADVWCHMEKISSDSAGYGFLVASIGTVFWKGANEPIEKKNGWGRLHLKFSIPDGIYKEPLVIYCWNSSKNVYYFDNISIKRNNVWKYFKN